MLPNKDEGSFLLLYEMQMMRTCVIYISLMSGCCFLLRKRGKALEDFRLCKYKIICLGV